MDTELTPLIMILFGLACFLAGFSKGGFGGALGFFITPMLALVMPLNLVVGIMLPVLIVADIFTLAAYWRKWDIRHIWILLGGALVGVTLATFILVNIPVELLKKLLAIIVLVFVAYRLLENRILVALTYQPRAWHGLLAGGVAGFSSALAHAGGPPITIFLLLQELEATIFVATSALFFALLNWIKVPYYLAAGLINFSFLFELIWLTPLIPVGVWTGKRLAGVISKRRFEQIVIVLLFFSALFLLFS
jgi:uncharacterized membrane protein YfcA